MAFQAVYRAGRDGVAMMDNKGLDLNSRYFRYTILFGVAFYGVAWWLLC
jgi:hypothetical protein